MPEPAIPSDEQLRAIVEALVFAAEEPLTLEDLIDLFPRAEKETLQGALDGLIQRCEPADRGVMVQRVAGGVRLATKPELGEWVRALYRSRNRRRLSAQALETLAIIAYRQPITTPEIQSLRGTDPSSVLEALLEKKLVRVMGRKKVVGKPFLYGTTPEFLAHFGLNTLQDLPSTSDFGFLAGAPPDPSVAAPALEVLAPGAADEPFEEDEDEVEDDAEDPADDEDDETERGDDGDDS